MKNALIIGGSSGIGLATVKKLAENQFNIIAIHRDRRQGVAAFEEILEDLSKKHKVTCKAFNIDATNEEKIASCLDEISDEIEGTFQVVTHAVSRGNLKPFVDEERRLSSQDLTLTIQAMGTNLQSWISAILDRKLLKSGANVIALTSEGNKRYWEGYGAVAMAKSSLETMANYLAVELAPLGITSNIIQAGITDTPSLRLIPGSDELIEETKTRNPFGRLTTPEDVANAIYLLTLPEASWISGSLIHVDGGEHLV